MEETFSSNDLSKAINLVSHTVMDKFRSSATNFLKLATLLLVFVIELYFILHKYQPFYHILLTLLLLSFSTLQLVLSKRPHIYLLHFSCLRPPKHHRVPISGFLENASLINCFDKDSIDFMAKIIYSSGQGNETYLPPNLFYIPPKTDVNSCIKEARLLFFPVMDDLLSKAQLSPLDVDILVLNCSGFCPSPSLSSILVNHYSMRSDVKTFNLSGMGCCAGSIGIDVAENLLRVHKNSYAVVLSGEITSTGWYPGKDRSKLLLNCLFRMGSSAVLLTNRREARNKAKYKLVHKIRRTRAFDDHSYRGGFREEDPEGLTGFSVSRRLLTVAGEVVRDNAVALGASLLPFTEKVRYALSVLIGKGEYVPDFGRVAQHFCLPPTNMAVVREIGRRLELTEEAMEPAMMTLHRFGNQSAAGMWYETAYMEAKGRVKRGDRVWQLWVGSGMKSTTLVWERLRAALDADQINGPWFDCIERFPVSLS